MSATTGPSAMAPVPSPSGGRGLRHALGTVFIWALIVVIMIWTLFPFYWAFINSIRDAKYSYGNLWLPVVQFPVTLAHWQKQWSYPELRQALLNSTIIAIAAATLAVVLGSLAAYGIARFRYHRPSNGSLTSWFLSQRIAPPVIFVAPFFLILRQFGLIDTLLGLIILNATFNLPFPVIILTQMFRDIPRELEEAAQIDGASRWEMFSRIALPLVAPGIVVSWILCLAFSWNEFLFALILSGPSSQTLPLLIGSGEGVRSLDFPAVSVRALVAILPPVILAVLTQRWIVRGLTLGAVKG